MAQSYIDLKLDVALDKFFISAGPIKRTEFLKTFSVNDFNERY